MKFLYKMHLQIVSCIIQQLQACKAGIVRLGNILQVDNFALLTTLCLQIGV